MRISVNQYKNVFFISDEHYWHHNVIKHCDRPFDDVVEMNECMISANNSTVCDGDVVIHLGDFCWRGKKWANQIIDRLNGNHIFINGSHDGWLNQKDSHEILEFRLGEAYIVCCHYPLLTWPRSNHGSICLHGHSHGTLSPREMTTDVGVDVVGYYPISFEQVMSIIRRQDG